MDKDDSLFGHFFALFPFNSSNLNSVNKIIRNSSQNLNYLKILKNIGQRIDKVQLINMENKGYLIKYNQGSICSTNLSKIMSNSAKHYETYLFIKCNKQFEDTAPKLISSELDSKLVLLN